MKLTLQVIDAPEGVALDPPLASLDAGRLTLGRSNDAGWTLPDPRRELAGTHCAVERDAVGFVLRAAQGARVDGRTLVAGDAAVLEHGSEVVLGGYRMRAALEGVAPAPPAPATTVSAILADVTPQPDGAPDVLSGTAPLPGRRAEEWVDLANIPRATRPETVPGWDGPPATVLPDDWNEPSGGWEPGAASSTFNSASAFDAASDLASHTEHAAATAAVVHLRPAAAAPAPAPRQAPAPQPGEAAAVAAFLAAAGMGATDDPVGTMRRAGTLMALMMDELAEREREVARRFEEAGASAPPAAPLPLGDLLATDRGEMVLRLRAGAVRETERRWCEAASRTLAWAETLAPARIERRVQGRVETRLPLGRERALWRELVEVAEADGPASPAERLAALLRAPIEDADDGVEAGSGE